MQCQRLGQEWFGIPVVFPLTVHLISTIPVALLAIGGDDGAINIGVRQLVSSYFTYIMIRDLTFGNGSLSFATERTDGDGGNRAGKAWFAVGKI